MNVPDYTACSISMGEMQQLLNQNGQSLFLVMCRSDLSAPAGIPPLSVRPEVKTASKSCGSYASRPEISPESFESSGSDLGCVEGANAGDDTASARMLTNYLHKLGIPAHISGYEYIKKGIELAMKDPSILGAITKELYPNIAKSCDSTPARVERAIRHAIETAWNRGNMALQEDLFGNTFHNLKGKPTNGEFIATIAELLRLQQSEMQI